MRRRIKARAGGASERRQAGSAEIESQLLAEALRGRRLGEVRGPSLSPRLIRAADRHGVVIALHRAYRRGNAEGDLEELASSAWNRRAIALRIARSSLDVSEWLREAAVVHAVVKGPALAAAYPDADREFIDLDVLVAPAQMLPAIAALERRGAEVLEPQPWPRDDGIAQLPLGLPSGVSVDLHTDLVHREHVRRDFRFPAEPLLERVTTADVLGQQIPVLDPEDTLTHVALHAMLSGGDRLIWLALVIGVMLQRAAMVLGTPVPPRTLRALRRRGIIWAYLLAAFERRRPTVANYGRNVHGQVLVRATRTSTITSMATLAGLIWTDVIVFVLQDRQHPWRSYVRQHWRAQGSMGPTRLSRLSILSGVGNLRRRRP
jgi:hypothetical protein